MNIPEPRKVLETRRKIEKQLCSKYALSEMDLAEYFNVSPKVIRNDIEEENIEISGKRKANVESLRHHRDGLIMKRIKEGEPESKVLEEYGLWKQPITPSKMKATVEELSIREENKKMLERALCLVEMGFSYIDSYKQAGGVSRIERTVVAEYLNNNKKSISSERFMYAEAALENSEGMNRKEKVELANTINKVNGVNKENVIANYITENSINKVDIEQSNSSNKRNADNSLIMEVYREWISGKTQQEIADERNLTRATINNYITKAKLSMKDELSENAITVRRRNVQEPLREKKEERTQKIVNICEQIKAEGKTPSITRVSKETGIDTSMVSTIMKEKGYITSSYDRCCLKTLENGSKYSEESYKKGLMTHFGYGPNAGTSNEINAYHERYLKQKETMISLNVSSDLRTHFNTNGGEIKNFFLPRNTRARNELDKEKETEDQMIAEM